MEVIKQQSEFNELDLDQGPRDHNVHADYHTQNIGASKGLMSNRPSQVLDEAENKMMMGQDNMMMGQDNMMMRAENMITPAGSHLMHDDKLPVLKATIRDLPVTGEELLHSQPHVNVQRVDQLFETGNDPSIMNTAVAAFNQQANSNLVNKEHELINKKKIDVNQHVSGVDALNAMPDSGLHKQEMGLGMMSGAERLENKMENKMEMAGERLDMAGDRMERKMDPMAQDLEKRVSPMKQDMAPMQDQAEMNKENQQVLGNAVPVDNANVDKEGNVVGQKEVLPMQSNAGMVTKGTLIFTPLEFKFIDEKKAMKNLKPVFKAKVGGHKKSSHKGNIENEVLTFNEPIKVGYSNQDDATLEIKKAGIFGKTIASGKVALADIINHRREERTVQLLDKQGVVGNLRVGVEFQPKGN